LRIFFEVKVQTFPFFTFLKFRNLVTD